MARRARRVSQGIPERRGRGGDLDPSRAGAGESRWHERGSAGAGGGGSGRGRETVRHPARVRAGGGTRLGLRHLARGASGGIFPEPSLPWSNTMRHIVMHAALVAASLTVVAGTETPTPTALRPSFAAGGRGPAAFITDVSRDTTAQNETPIAVNPTNPSNLLTGANDWNYNDGVAYNVSFDGGKAWSATLPNGFIPGLTRYTNDPDVPGTGFYDAAGDPYV